MTTANIPPALRELAGRDQWVAWSRNKVPISPITGGPASVSDPATWGSLEAAKHHRAAAGLPGVGYVFNTDDPYVAIDLDHARDPQTGALEPWAERIIDALDTYTEVSPSGAGVHIIARATTEHERGARRAVDAGNGAVEVYTTRRYFTVTGRHLPGTPRTIEERSAQASKLLAWAGGGAQRHTTDARPRTASYETTDPMRWLGDALDHIDATPHDTWLAVGMALRNDVGDNAFALYDRWSATAENYGGTRATWQRWRSFPDNGTGQRHLGTIVYLADQHGYVLPDDCRGRVVADIPPEFVDGWDEWIATQEYLAGGDEGLSIRVIDYADAWADTTPPEPDIVGPGILGEGDMMLVAGPPKSLKSFLVLDMVRAWCLGETWHGMTPARPLYVAMIQLEIKADNMRQRIQLCAPTIDGERLRGRLVYTDRCAPTLTAEWVREVSRALLGALDAPPDILVIDPMANIYTGDNENDNGQMLKFLRHVQVMRNHIHPAAALILVHHASKRPQTEREAEPFAALRGASSLRGAYDTGLYIERGQGESIRMWTECRNGPGFAQVDMVLQGGTFVGSEQVHLASIVDTLLADAADGVAWTSSAYVAAHAEDMGLDPRALGGIISSLITSGDLIRWTREDAPAPERSKGWLGVDGMIFRECPV